MFQFLAGFWKGHGDSLVYSKIAEDDAQRFSLDSVAHEEQRLLAKIRKQRQHIVSLACLSGLLLLIVAAQTAYTTRATWHSSTPIPRMPRQIVTFEKSDLYASSSSTESDLAWKALVPPEKGFVSIDNAAKYDLPPGMDVEQSGELYNLAAFHQIHCLSSIRDYLSHLQFAVERNQTEQLSTIIPDSQQEHVLDCFDYLRQSLMCAGDTTLEYPTPGSRSDQGQQIVDGWGVKHQCVDWDAVLRFAKANSPPALG